MSNVPLLFRDWWSDYDVDFEPLFQSRPRTSRLIDQHFGRALRRNDLITSLANTQISSPTPSRSPYYRPWGSALSRQDSGSTLNVDKNKFEIILDVQQFNPNEISVKTCEKFVVIEGKHDEKQDEHGYVTRHFTRKYLLPPNYKPDSVTSTLSSDGILTVSAAAPEALPPQTQERSVTITHVGPSRTENQSVSQDQPKIEHVN